MKKVATDKATLEQLRAFATSTLGIEINPSFNRLAVLAQVQQVWDKPEIDVDDTVAETKRSGSRPPAPARGKVELDSFGKPKKYIVRIAIQDGDGGENRVELSVNGKAMLVERGVESAISAPYLEALEHAIEKRYDPLPNGKGYNPVARLVPRYPYQIVRTLDA